MSKIISSATDSFADLDQVAGMGPPFGVGSGGERCEMLVKDIMQPNVFCVEGRMTVKELYLALMANEIAGAPVLDERDYLIGVVSMTDVAACIAGDKSQSSCGYYSHPDTQDGSLIKASSISKSKRVSDIMTNQIHKVSMDASLEEVLDLILEEDIHRVIVTHRSHVVGIVTSGDLLHAFREYLRDDEEEDDDDFDEDEEEDEEEDD